MKKIRVLHLSSEKAWRGGEQQIAYLLDELAGTEVENYVAVRKGSAFEKYALEKALIHFSLPFANSFDLRTALAVRHICHTHNIALVHLHSSKSHALAVLASVLGNRATLILSRRVDFVPKQNILTRWKYNHKSIRRIVCVSDKIKQTMQAYVKRPERCITIHSGVDLRKFESKSAHSDLRVELNISPETLLIGNTSALDEHKDYYTFIDALAILLDKKLPVKGVIIGTGPLEDELKKYVSSRKLDREIFFTGFRSDVRKILPSLSLFLMTTRIEGLGTSILDAFLAGVPVVASNVGGIPEMIVHNQTGMLATAGQPAEFATHCERILTDGAFKNTLVAGAKQKVTEFSKERTAEKTLALYREMAPPATTGAG